MAGPLSGIGVNTQSAQLAQSQQQQSLQNSQGARQANEQERPTRADRAQPPSAPVNEAQNTERNNGGEVTQEAARQEQFFAANVNAEDVDPNTPRGSLIDIAV